MLRHTTRDCMTDAERDECADVHRICPDCYEWGDRIPLEWQEADYYDNAAWVCPECGAAYDPR